MTVLQKLRERLSGRRTDAVASYWATVERLATGKLAERAVEAAVAALETLMPALGKTSEDIDHDVALLARLHGLANGEAERVEARDGLRAAVQQSAALERQAGELRAQAQQLAGDADRVRRQAQARATEAQDASKEAANLRRLLAERGHPGHVASKAAERNASALRTAEGELAAVDAEIQDIEQRMARGEYRVGLERVEDHLVRLRKRRAEVAARVAELQATPAEVAR